MKRKFLSLFCLLRIFFTPSAQWSTWKEHIFGNGKCGNPKILRHGWREEPRTGSSQRTKYIDGNIRHGSDDLLGTAVPGTSDPSHVPCSPTHCLNNCFDALHHPEFLFQPIKVAASMENIAHKKIQQGFSLSEDVIVCNFTGQQLSKYVQICAITIFKSGEIE